MRNLTPREAFDVLQSNPGALFVDVRSRAEFAAGHPEGAVNVPISEPDAYGQMAPNPLFAQAMTALAGPKERLIVLTCRSGARSARGCQVMEANGFADTVNVDGGWAGGAVAGWAQSGLPGSTDTGAGVGWDSVRAQLGL
jgi:rhodanese-related sulfurtransferase